MPQNSIFSKNSDTVDRLRDRKSKGEPFGVLGAAGIAAAGTLVASTAQAQETPPSGFSQLPGTQFSVQIQGNTAIISGGPQTISTAASNVFVNSAGQVFVADSVMQALLPAVGGGAVGGGAAAAIGGAALGGLALAAGGGGGSSPAAPVITTPILDITQATGSVFSLGTASSFSDRNGDTITYSAVVTLGAGATASLASVGLQIDPTTGVISSVQNASGQ
ncbi:MAG: hypothetical protein AAF386_14035, partial [Pseudomonadota bacterium]